MLQVHDNMPQVQRIISTRITHKCICTGKLEAFITAAGDHWHCSRIWQVCSRAPNVQKVDQHTRGKWLIHGNQRRKDKQSRSLELPCKISYMGTLIWQTIATCSVQYSEMRSRCENIPRGGGVAERNLPNIVTDTNMVANPSKPMGWNINTYKSCLPIIRPGDYA